MHVFCEEFLLFIAFAAMYLSSNSVSAWTGGGGLLSNKRTGMDKGRKGAENWQKGADILYG